MKKAKVVVNQTAKNNRLTFGKKAALASLGLVATLGVVSVVVPTSNIPGFSYIAQAIGLNADATRDLTMADFAFYALGTKDNKIQELRAGNLSYNGTDNYGGGLSPFATLTTDRLAEAYAKNAEEAAKMEKTLGGKITPFNKNAVNTEVVFDPQLIAKGFDPAKIMGNSQAARSGAMEALATAAGQQAEAFGSPLSKGDLKNVADVLNLKESGISNIVGGGNIASIASKNDNLYDTVMQAARAITGTSLFGVSNPELNRTDTAIGRPVYGLFKDLGNSYFYSRYAVGAKLPTAASDIASAAFDGGSPQDESLITDETSQGVGGTTNPMLSLNSSAQSVNACQQMKETYKQTIATSYQTIENIKVSLRSLANNRTKTPGFCFGKNSNRHVKIERDTWNDMLPELESLCETIIRQRKMFAGQCGIVFEEPIKSCSEMAQNLKIASVEKAGIMYIKCRNLSAFDRTGIVHFDANGKRKVRKWERVYKRLYKQYKNDGYDETAAEEAAALGADNEVYIDDNDIDVDKLCKTSAECEEYFDEKIEEAFAFRRIIDITSLPKK